MKTKTPSNEDKGCNKGIFCDYGEQGFSLIEEESFLDYVKNARIQFVKYVSAQTWETNRETALKPKTMESKLISMVSYILEQDKLEFIPKGKDYADEWSDFCLIKLDAITEYANFLKQPLELGMFVPCDLDGNVLIKHNSYDSDINDYSKAKERVIFEGFSISQYKAPKLVISTFLEIEFWEYSNKNVEIYLTDFSVEKPFKVAIKTIEDLIPYNLTLSNNKSKELNL